MNILSLLCFCAIYSASGIVLDANGEQVILYHSTATFGPASGEYSVTGAPFVSIPSMLCEDPPDGEMAGKIVLVQRGNCPFLDKALRAQRFGAVGIIVGEYNKDVIFRMNFASNASTEAAKVTIPCVSTAWTSFQQITAAMKADPLTTLTMDLQGDYTGNGLGQDESILRYAGVLLLSLPCLWCASATGYIIFKKISYRRERVLRLERAAALPEVPYRRTSESMAHVADAPMSERVHNDSCAICLDEFHMEEPIAVLPCFHGFHRRCLDPWLDRSALCPICKQSILDQPAVDVEPREPEAIAMTPLPPISGAFIININSNNNDNNNTTSSSSNNSSSSSSSGNDSVSSGRGDARSVPLLAFEGAAAPSISSSCSSSSSSASSRSSCDDEEGAARFTPL